MTSLYWLILRCFVQIIAVLFMPHAFIWWVDFLSWMLYLMCGPTDSDRATVVVVELQSNWHHMMEGSGWFLMTDVPKQKKVVRESDASNTLRIQKWVHLQCLIKTPWYLSLLLQEYPVFSSIYLPIISDHLPCISVKGKHPHSMMLPPQWRIQDETALN